MSGYIQIELGGVNRGLKFGNRALLNVMAKHKVDEGIKFSFELIVDLIYFALLNNCQIKKVDPDFSYEEVENWTDEIPMDQLMVVFNSFQGSFQSTAAPGEPLKVTKPTVKKGESLKKP